MIFILVVLREFTKTVNEIVPVRRVDCCVLRVAEELCEIFRNHLFGTEEVIEDDENDFRFVVVIPTGREF